MRTHMRANRVGQRVGPSDRRCARGLVSRIGRGAALALLLVGAGMGCNDLSGLAGKQQLPSGIPDPNSLKTRAGALGVYQSVLAVFQAANSQYTTPGGVTGTDTSAGAFVDYVLASGLLTDELGSGELGEPTINENDEVLLTDTRQLFEGVTHTSLDNVYTELQGVRNSAHLAIEALAAYDTVDSPALRGQMYALAGYSELLLADLYCSGVPLSTLDFDADFTYHAGSTTEDLYHAAVAQFDSAIALSGDSVRILNLARVGKGRAWLALAQYDSAAVAVDSVPTSYSYQFTVQWRKANGNGGAWQYVEADTQGMNGLPYLSSGDPRTAGAVADTSQYGMLQYAPVKYGGAALGGTAPVAAPITVASGIEARLIQAEAAYQGVVTGSGSWLAQLNALRGSIGLSDTTDPGTPTGEVALIFRERAFWLYVTGERQGDLRRLLRNYGTEFPDQRDVYPTGAYPLFGLFSYYGTDVTAPIPVAEHANPLFTGCRSRGA